MKPNETEGGSGRQGWRYKELNKQETRTNKMDNNPNSIG